MATVSNKPTGNRYHLHAYVCGGACVRRVTLGQRMPTVDFPQVFASRPNDCRYAVVSQWDMAEHKFRYVVFDLFEVKKKTFATMPDELIAPKPRLVHDDLDAAIMGTVMLYDEGR
jgi:hypothetical protein